MTQAKKQDFEIWYMECIGDSESFQGCKREKSTYYLNIFTALET